MFRNNEGWFLNHVTQMFKRYASLPVIDIIKDYFPAIFQTYLGQRMIVWHNAKLFVFAEHQH